MLSMLDPGGSSEFSAGKNFNTGGNQRGDCSAGAGIDAAAHRELDYNIYRLRHDERGGITNGIFTRYGKAMLQEPICFPSLPGRFIVTGACGKTRYQESAVRTMKIKN